jgi:hypothetical protein
MEGGRQRIRPEAYTAIVRALAVDPLQAEAMLAQFATALTKPARPPKTRAAFMTEYGGKPTLIARALDLMRTAPHETWTRQRLIAELGIAYPGEAGRVLKDLCERGHAARIGRGRYQLTRAARTA